MQPTTAFDFGDVVLLPFPLTERSPAKKRPAVVVSSRTYHQESGGLIVAPVTTKSEIEYPLEVVIKHWQEAGLLFASVARPVLATIEPSLTLKRLGRLHPEDRASLRSALVPLLG